MESEKNERNCSKISSSEEDLYQERDSEILPYFMLCKICFLKEINVCISHCGHAFACVECMFAVNVCSVCSEPFNYLVKMSIFFDPKPLLKENPKDSGAQLVKDSQINLNDRSSCLCCEKNVMEFAFLPCRHLYACFECAKEFNVCPIKACSTPISAYLRVNLQ